MPDDSVLRLLLWIVALNGGLLVVLLWHRGLAGRRVFVGLLAADALLAAFLLGAHLQDHPLAFVAIGAFACLVVVPIPLRILTALAVRRGRFDLALRLSGLREMLQPGSMARQERELIQFLQRVHAGDTGEVLQMLRARCEQAAAAGDLEQQALISEQLMTLLLLEHRYDEAVAHARQFVSAEMVAHRPRLATAVIRAFGEEGDIAEVVRALSLRIGAGGSADPDAGEEDIHSKVMTLAYLGRPEALERFFERPEVQARNEPKVQAFWLGVAHQYAGDAETARREFDRAESLLDAGDEPARESIRARRASLTRPVDIVAPADPEQADRLVHAILEARPREAAPLGPEQVRAVPLRQTPVTVALVVTNLVAFAWVWLAGSEAAVNRRLIEAGASLQAAVAQGQWWRLVTASFLHAGWFHVGLNTLMLWFLGRFTERMLGPVRLLIVYVLGGVAGNLVSHSLRAYPVSVGASSSLFALLGATFIALVLSRGRIHEGWRRYLLVLVGLVTALSFLPGAVDIRQIDNYAHLGGLAGGLVLGALLLLSAGRPGVRWFGPLAGALAVAALLYGAVGVVTSDLDGLGFVQTERGSVRVAHPVSWHLQPGPRPGHVVLLNLLAPDRIDLERVPARAPAPDAWQQERLSTWRARAREAGPGERLRVQPVPEGVLPAGFRAVRLDVTRSGDRYVVVEVYGGGRASSQGRWRARVQTDAARARRVLRVVGQILGRLR